jgi:hypothetical protein
MASRAAQAGILTLSGDQAAAARRDLASLAEDPRTDTSRGLWSAAELLERAEVGQYWRRGVPVVTFAIADGWPGEVVIVAAKGGDAARPITDEFLDYLEPRLSVARVLTVQTKRRGLVRRLAARGFELDSYTLRKVLR